MPDQVRYDELGTFCETIKDNCVNIYAHLNRKLLSVFVPDKMSLDNGYISGDNLEAFDGKEIDVYIATGKGEKKDQRPIEDSKRKIKKSDFIYDEDRDCFVCPAGHSLELKRESNDGKKVYQAIKAECDACPYKVRCCSSKRGEPRTINTDDKEPLRQKMNEKMDQASSKEIYKKRKKIVKAILGGKVCLESEGLAPVVA